MKGGNIFKRILISTIYIVLAFICILGIFFLIYKSSNKENDSIVRAQDSGTYLRSINPRFLVDFVNDEHIRFETVSSYSNPFEGKESSVWEKLRYILGIKQERKGIEISLIDVSYDQDLRNILEERDINISEFNLNKNFELISSGRVIGDESEEAVSKDTVISRNVYKGVDIEYQIIKGKGLKEEIVLREIPEYVTNCDEGECTLPVNRFLFKLQLDEGLVIKRSIDGSKQYPSGALYITDEEGNYYAHFLPEFAVDAVGTKTSNVVSNISLTDTGEYMFEVILDPEWLLSEERVFPIRIDPSIVHDSTMAFESGVYDRVGNSQTLMLSLLADRYLSGVYTSTVLDLGSNSKLNSISWSGFTQQTRGVEEPYSPFGLIVEEHFNNLASNKVKWGEGALQLDSFSDSKTVVVNANSSTYFTLELWSYLRNIQNEQYIFKSNLLNLKVEDGKYVIEDSNSVEQITQLPVKYNSWEYIALIFDIQNSKVSLLVNELEQDLDIEYTDVIPSSITFGESIGYIDSVRMYERLVPRNELLSNSQYSNLYLQYSHSADGLTWSEWYTKSKYLPIEDVGEGNISLSSDTEDLSTYEVLSFESFSFESTEIVLGSSKFGTGILEEGITFLNESEGSIETIDGIKYLDLLFTPNTVHRGCILALEGLEVYTLDTGKVEILLNGEVISTSDMYIPTSKNILSISLTDSITEIYLNGNVFQSNTSYSLTPTTYSIGNGCTDIPEFNGEIKDVRVSSQQKSSKDILQYSDISKRTYAINPFFRAKLQNDAEILNMNSIQFSLAEEDSSQLISNLYVGDTLVISEGGYFAEGRVSFVNKDTGLVEVENWSSNSSIPELGFSTQAAVSKWQREYIFTNTFLDETTQSIYIKGDIKIKGVDFSNMIDSEDVVMFENMNSRYLKYRFIYMTSRYGISSLLGSVNIDFESGGPSMDQIMRHGKWFNEGSKQNFWWIESN